MGSTPTIDLVSEVNRRHMVVAKAVSLAAALIFIATFFWALRALVINELNQVLSTTLRLHDRAEPDLNTFVESVSGYHVYVDSGGRIYQSEQFQLTPAIERRLARASNDSMGTHVAVLPVDGFVKLTVIHRASWGLIFVARSHNPLAYYIAMALIVVAVGLILFLFVTRGRAYLTTPVEKEITWIQQLDRAKENFFAAIFHELGTPLTTLMTRLETLIERESDPPRKRDLELAYLDAQRMALISSDQLQRSRFEAGRVNLHREWVHLEDLFEIISIRLQILLKHRGKALQTHVDGDVSLLGDRLKLEQAIVNLVTNAVKYGGRTQTIRIDGHVIGSDVAIDVVDQGPGFDLNRVSELVKPFHRHRPAGTDARMESSGIGLFLVDEIARAHGGELQFSHQVDGFTARLRLPPQPAPVASGSGRSAR